MGKLDHKKVLQFWFEGVTSKWPKATTYTKESAIEGIPPVPMRWFRGGETTDEFIRKNFEDYVVELGKQQSEVRKEWAQEAQSHLAAIIVLDQFTRNLYRNSAKAFEKDALTVQMTQDMLENGQYKELEGYAHRHFAIMPLMHAEDLDTQNRCVQLLQDMKEEAPEGDQKIIENAIQFAIDHRDRIELFGRFPHRNDVLNRESTEEEKLHFEKHGGF